MKRKPNKKKETKDLRKFRYLPVDLELLVAAVESKPW